VPRKGYKTVGNTSLPIGYIEAMERLKNDPDYVREMHSEGHLKVSKALIIRKALRAYLEGKGQNIDQTSDTEGK